MDEADSQPTVAEGPARPDRLTLVAFAAVVVMVGLNLAAVKTTVAELAPMWSAGIRFAAAAVLLAAVVLLRRLPLPRGRALVGAAVFGALSFGAFFAFAYWGIQRLSVGTAALVFASVPLVTFVAAVIHRLEPFRWLTLVGGLLAVGGIAVMGGGPGAGTISIVGLLAMLAAAICAAEAAVVAKRIPAVPPLVMNAVGMLIGAVMLLGLSFASGEAHVLPSRGATWLALAYLVLFGSIATFVTYLFVLRRWTASAVSYEFVLAPLVAVLVAWAFQGERVTGTLLAGGALILAGVYVGALLHLGRRTVATRAGARQLEPVAAPMGGESQHQHEIAGVPADCIRCP